MFLLNPAKAVFAALAFLLCLVLLVLAATTGTITGAASQAIAALCAPPTTTPGSAGTASTPASASASPAAGTGLSAAQQANARIIITVGQQLSVPAYGQVIAIATALQESDLINLDHGDHDSLGLFQQRPSQGWGTPAQIMDPTYAATAFYRALLAIPNWPSQPLATDAQAVQRSATPDAYARWQPQAEAIVAADGGGTAATCAQALGALDGASGVGAGAAEAALRWLGTPYSYGGGTDTGPSTGFCTGAAGYLNGVCVAKTTVGFDCSGLVMYAWWQATGGTVQLPHNTVAQFDQGTRVPLGDLQPGDLVFYVGSDGTVTAPGHVALYLGANQLVDAPYTGASVHVITLDTKGTGVNQIVGATRP